MPYLNLDDNYPEHPKVYDLSDGAFRLHTSALAFCAKQLTDGLLPAKRVPALSPTYKPKLVAELVAAGMWHEDGKGCGTTNCPVGDAGQYVMHDFLAWNKPKAWWKNHNAKRAERQARFRANHASRNPEDNE